MRKANPSRFGPAASSRAPCNTKWITCAASCSLIGWTSRPKKTSARNWTPFKPKPKRDWRRRRRSSSAFNLRNPNQRGIVGPPFVDREIPVFRTLESGRVTIQQSEVRALAVQVGVNIVLLSDARQAAVVKQPDCVRRQTDGGEPHLVAAAGGVDVFV